jgi:hypothetical protein
MEVLKPWRSLLFAQLGSDILLVTGLYSVDCSLVFIEGLVAGSMIIVDEYCHKDVHRRIS